MREHSLLGPATCTSPSPARGLTRAMSKQESGWNRGAQDSAETELPPVADSEPVRVRFLDRPVGYANVRWLLIAVLLVMALLVLFVKLEQRVDAHSSAPGVPDLVAALRA